ncbi:alpha/beta fold hydrolase [Taibaiella soli]|uniref:Alpha/beta hydrolase n=1 Tax=Taibaiella soli TaxID=1649169 RepID=A0A2W2A6R8_9BACT|nr:alpha/beta hydrolase [Taibaiella soli]PZF70961.1 alpha/beta hydrolase [Taibaiella soli]
MKQKIVRILFVLLVSFSSLISNAQKPASPPANFKSKIANVNGIKIHYVIGGKGDALVLIHGFGQNWYMWNRLLPELSKHFTVIAPDLRGLGESEKTEGGYDKKTMATDIHELVKQLGYSKASVAGHDIGFMVAYAYAAQYPGDVTKLALVDALLPGIEPVWTSYGQKAWWWNFFSWPAAANVVTGREETFMTSFWPEMEYNKNSFTKEETAEFVRAYSVPGSIKCSFKWFAAFPQDEKDNLELAKNKLNMPVLALAGEYHTASFLEDHVKLVANNVKEVTVTNAKHWLVQEQTEQVKKALLDFFE